MILIIGALLGFISVAFGAYAEHGLRETLNAENFHSLEIAIRYNQLNAVIISVIGLILSANLKWSRVAALKWSSLLFIIGTLLFSFSIYTAVFFSLPSIVKITPFGGVIIMIAWILLAASAVSIKKLR